MRHPRALKTISLCCIGILCSFFRIQSSIGNEPLDLVFETGADTIVVFPSAISKGVELAYDGDIPNLGLRGGAVRPASSDDTVAITGLNWIHESVMLIDEQAEKSDIAVVLESGRSGDPYRTGPLGIDIVKRDNAVLNFQGSQLDIKPNASHSLPFDRPLPDHPLPDRPLPDRRAAIIISMLLGTGILSILLYRSLRGAHGGTSGRRPVMDRIALLIGVSIPVQYYGMQLVAAPFFPGFSLFTTTASDLGSNESLFPEIFNFGVITLGMADILCFL